jgi:hypothetical protein
VRIEGAVVKILTRIKAKRYLVVTEMQGLEAIKIQPLQTIEETRNLNRAMPKSLEMEMQRDLRE